MHTFRFNPVYDRWVVVGPPLLPASEIKPAHFLEAGKGQFAVASYPGHPFILDHPGKPVSSNLLYKPQPAVGEYELVLYQGNPPFSQWKNQQWEEWLLVLQQRILQCYHNPYLHHLQIYLATSQLSTVPEYERVGDLIASEYRLTTALPALSEEVAEKLLAREVEYLVAENEVAALYVPSAPLANQEVWCLPKQFTPRLEEVTSKERQQLAQLLSVLFTRLQAQFPKTNYTLEISTHLTMPTTESVWWMRLCPATDQSVVLPITLPPEKWVKQLRQLLGG